MSRTVDEKLKYNEGKKTPFSTGYKLAVFLYRNYVKGDAEMRASIKGSIDTSKELAKTGDELSKGFMCGIRDAANERKARQKK